MNIIEALKSGKPFKRPGDETWYDHRGQASPRGFHFLLEDLIADDWEIKQEPREFWILIRGNAKYIYENIDQAEAKCFSEEGDKVIHVREVL